MTFKYNCFERTESMKKRLLTAAVGCTLAVVWLIFMYTPAYSAVMAIVAAIATYEMLKVYKIENKLFFALCLLTSACTVLYADYKDKLNIPLFPVITGIILVSLIIMVLNHEKLVFSDVVCSIFSAMIIPASLSCVVLLRDVYKIDGSPLQKVDGVFFIIMAFLCSWLTDGFALFAGMAFGKHKMCPKISPKKTIEGAVGGVVGNTLVCIGVYYLFKLRFNLTDTIKLWEVILISFVLACISIFGDLAASTIKRSHGIKDFGNLLPGHGGIMDRFDSSLFVFPALYSFVVVFYHL